MTSSRADTIATAVNWYGPYQGTDNMAVLTNARKGAREAQKIFGSGWKGLYLAIGTEADEAGRPRRGPHIMLYVGVADRFETRLTPNHRVLGNKANVLLRSLWLGDVAVHSIPDASPKKLDVHRDMVEWATAFFLELPFNERKRQNPPRWSCVVINRWWKTDLNTRSSTPNPRWPDVIDYDRDRESAFLIRHGERRVDEKHNVAVRRPVNLAGAAEEPA